MTTKLLGLHSYYFTRIWYLKRGIFQSYFLASGLKEADAGLERRLLIRNIFSVQLPFFGFAKEQRRIQVSDLLFKVLKTFAFVQQKFTKREKELSFPVLKFLNQKENFTNRLVLLILQLSISRIKCSEHLKRGQKYRLMEKYASG